MMVYWKTFVRSIISLICYVQQILIKSLAYCNTLLELNNPINDYPYILEGKWAVSQGVTAFSIVQH